MLFVILCVVAVMIITGFVDILIKSFVLNEIQSIMDVVGTSALRAGVDTQKLRNEVFEIDENFVKQAYKLQINELITTGEKSKVRSIYIPTSDIRLTVQNTKWGLGISNKARPQAILDVVARVRVEASSFFDRMSSLQKTFYNSFSDKDFHVTYVGKAEDGSAELIIRSVSRIVYR